MKRTARPRVTYANVTATLALVLALGGTSYAAVALPRDSVGTTQLRNDAVTTSKIKPGNVGPADLSAGARQLAAAGPVSPALVSGLMHDVTGSSVYGTNWRRAPLTGATPYNDTNLAGAASMSPNRPLVARDLTVRIDNDVPAGGVVRVDLVAVPTFGNEPAALSCTITGTAAPGEVSCTSSGAGQVPPGSLVYMLSTVGGGTAETNTPGSIRWGFTLEPAP